MNPELHATRSDIAVIGYAARVPGAGSAQQFWENLEAGVESIRAFSAEELESVGVSKARLEDPHYVRAGAPLHQPDAFDAAFFGISPRDAAIMDPQHRLFLESAWEALEHAGYAAGTFTGSTGVFAGSGTNAYLIQNLLSDPELVETEGMFLLRQTGNDKDVLATRLSYQMNLRGPSLNIQTGQSTSLVTVHVACQTLLHKGCDMAIAGAVSIELPHAVGYRYRQNEVLSRDGHCRAFDAASTGTVFGSGLGIVILRRLSDAIAAGDTIHAVIKGTAVNNDGNRKGGFLAPSVAGQVEVIEAALAAAGVDPASVDYIETHGTGTPIGDPIELNALSQVFSHRERQLKIGSVKTNVGHLDTAAGMAGLLKAIMALERRQIPATLHFKNFHPQLASDTARLQMVDRLTDWTSADGPRRAGVTSLGIGGTNAHVVLEEAPDLAPSAAGRTTYLLTLSAKSDAALEDATQALAGHLRKFPAENLADVAHTLHVGRSEFAHRRAFVCRDHQEALRIAEQPPSSAMITGKTVEAPSVAFLFSGQGSQYCNMGREIYQTESVFRQWLDECAVQAQPHMGLDFRDILYPPEAGLGQASEQIKLTWNAQPILFAFEYALARLWMSWGVRPAKLVGHSLGEYTAACLSGVFTLEDVIPLICARGNLMKKVSEGAILAVGLSEVEIGSWIKNGLDLAAVNGLEQCVISGPTADILALKDELKKEGIPSHRLETSHAFHSSSIEPVLDAFMNVVRQKKMRAPQIPIISNVSGTWLTEKEATDPAYWARHFRGTVRFHDGLKVLQTDRACFLLEVGPGETLCTFARRNRPKESPQKIFPSLPRAGGKNGDLSGLLSALGNLWVHGNSIDWKGFHAQEHLRRVPLPTYPFQRKKFWMGPKVGTNWLADSMGKAPTAAPFISPKETAKPVDSAPVAHDEIETVLEQMWRQLLGLDQVDAGTDFFESGGHSLIAVRLFAEIRKRFGVEMGLATLFEARTLGGLAELIRQERKTDRPEKKSDTAPTLVSIRSHGAKTTPLFLIHSVGGNVLNFEHLGRHLPEDQAVYAIEPRGLRGLPLDYRVEDMARHYIEQIRERQPEGPYFVVGHSFGGLVTYEIACQLSAQNQPMGLVGLLDTYQQNRIQEDVTLQAAPSLGRNLIFQRIRDDLRSATLGKNRIEYLRKREPFLREWLFRKMIKNLYRSADKLSSRLGWPMPPFLRNVEEANWLAQDHFNPRTYDGTVVFFRCQSRLPTDPPDSSKVWRRLVKGELVIREVPGDHNSMLKEPGVKILAEQILSYLQPQNGG